MNMEVTPLIFGLALSGAALIIFVAIWFARFARRRRLLRDLDLRLLHIKLPAGQNVSANQQNNRDLATEIAKSSQLFSALAKPGAPLIFEVAVHNVGEQINFYIATPDANIEFVKRQIEALWPGAQVVLERDDYTIFNSTGDVQFGFLRLKQNYAIPIRSFAEANVDTFDLILSNFSKVNALAEGLALQVILRPASTSPKKSVLGAIDKLKKGKKFADAVAQSFGKMLVSRFKPASVGENTPGLQNVPPVIDTENIKLLEQKISKPLYEVNIRFVSSAPTPYRATELIDGLINSFGQFSAPLRNEFKVVKLGGSKRELFKFVFREFDGGEAMILNADEVASLFHLPLPTTAIPRLTLVKAKEAPPPPNLSASGTLFGESVWRGEVKPIYITDDDRRRHIYVIGQTGTGKSGMLQHAVLEDIKAGKGVAVIDPHGDLVDSVLGSIPQERYKDIVIFDPGDRAYPLGLNMLEYDQNYPEQKTFIVNEMLNIFDKLYDLKTTGGPMFEQYMRNALLLLMEDAANEPATLMEVPRVFTDAEFRKRKLARISNPVIIDFWEKEASKAGGEASLANITPYVTSKFSNFIANDYMRPIISQVHSAFNFRSIMDEGKILLVNLAKGRIGELNANLLGMIVVGKLLMAAFSRVDVPQDSRRDFYLYIDEFQNFTTDSIATILSEARKYRLNLVIAHQYIAQLKDSIKSAVFGNVGSMAVFRVGADDAEFLVKQFEPVFSKSDLLGIDNRNAYVKLLIGGQTSQPFNIRTIEVKAGDPRVRAELKEFSRKVYGASRESVESETLARLRN